MSEPKSVSREQWLTAREELLKKEKEFTRLRDELSQQRREMPWVKVDKDYQFKGSNGDNSLSDLFGSSRQLIVYHFMMGPDWEEGCPSCSFWADNYNGIDIHLQHRDTQLVTISRNPLSAIQSYKERMKWDFEWFSSLDSDFNFDYGVSFDETQKERGKIDYNYQTQGFYNEEMPGISVFCKSESGEIFHTYSCYSRGLDMMNAAYHYLDLTPKGRDEDDLEFSMAWLRRRDQYGEGV